MDINSCCEALVRSAVAWTDTGLPGPAGVALFFRAVKELPEDALQTEMGKLLAELKDGMPIDDYFAWANRARPRLLPH